MKKQILGYADFETTTVDYSNYKDLKEYYLKEPNIKYPKIYSWAFCVISQKQKLFSDLKLKKLNIKYESYTKDNIYFWDCYYGISGKSFVEMVYNLKVDVKIFFNNSKGFDNHFLISELINNGFFPQIVKNFGKTELDKIRIEENINLRRKYILGYLNKHYKNFNELPLKKKAKLLKSKENALFPKEFSTLTNNNTQIYQVKIATKYFVRTKDFKRPRTISINDNLLLFPMAIKKMGQTIQNFMHKKYNIDIKYDKLDKHYKVYNCYESFEDFENDNNEKDYLFNDVIILAMYHVAIADFLPVNKWKMTAASTAYEYFLEMYFNRYKDYYIKKNKLKKVEVKNGGYKYTWNNKMILKNVKNIVFEEMFPTKWLDKDDNFNKIYDWYSGGATIVNENYRGKILKNVSVIDINSDYPYQMSSEKLCPWGRPQLKKDENYNFGFYTVEVLRDLYITDYLSVFYDYTAPKRYYNRIFKPGMILKLTEPELEWFIKITNAREGDLNIIGEYFFKSIKFKNIFGDYINYFYNLKEKASREKNEALKIVVKLFLNSLYGKFGQKNYRESKVFDASSLSWITQAEITKSKYYLPIAVAITAYARLYLSQSLGKKYENFIYCDTDSLFIKDFVPEDFPNIELDPFKLGAWDQEKTNLTGLVRRPKQYLFKDVTNKNVKVAYAGINFNVETFTDEDEEISNNLAIVKDILTFEDFIYGKKIDKQLAPFRIVGQGIILEERIKEIKPIWDYKKYDEQLFWLPEHFTL